MSITGSSARSTSATRAWPARPTSRDRQDQRHRPGRPHPGRQRRAHCGATLASTPPQDHLPLHSARQRTDPYPNTVTVETHPTGFTNDIDKSPTDSVNLFQPSIKVTRRLATRSSKEGDPGKYKVTIENASSGELPDLVIDKISDSLQGDLTNPANYTSSTCGASLASGGSCTTSTPARFSAILTRSRTPSASRRTRRASRTTWTLILRRGRPPPTRPTRSRRTARPGREPVPAGGPGALHHHDQQPSDADLVVTADDGIRRSPWRLDRPSRTEHASPSRLAARRRSRTPCTHGCRPRCEIRPPEHVRAGRDRRLPCR